MTSEIEKLVGEICKNADLWEIIGNYSRLKEHRVANFILDRESSLRKKLEDAEKCHHGKCPACGFDDTEHIDDLEGRIKELEQSLSEAREAFFKYGYHIGECRYKSSADCVCGFEKAQQALAQEGKGA